MLLRTLLLASALAACADPPDNGADFKYLHAAVIAPRCATSGCHSYGNYKISTSRTGPLDLQSLDQPDPGDSLDLGACENLQTWVLRSGPPDSPTCGIPNPNDPTSPLREPESDLERLLDGTYGGDLCDFQGSPKEYTQMPADFPLTPAEQRMFKQWIAAGAPCN